MRSGAGVLVDKVGDKEHHFRIVTQQETSVVCAAENVWLSNVRCISPVDAHHVGYSHPAVLEEHAADSGKYRVAASRC